MRKVGAFIALYAFAAACGRDKNVAPLATGAPTSSPAPASATPTTAPSTIAPSASAEPPLGGESHCLSAEEREQNIAVSFKLRSQLAVVRVAPDDVLWLRQGPNAREKTTGKLSHDARNVTATGRVCRTGETTWYEVSSGNERGFANGHYLMPATEPADETPRFAKFADRSRPASPEALVRAVVQGLTSEHKEPSEVRFDVTELGTGRNGTRAVVVLHACCFADDSVLGEQIWLDALERDGRWILERARVIKLCPRGTSGSRCI
jgi:hypothetical protein